MTQTKPNNFAFIDAQNLYLGTKSQWREIDYARFRVFLKDKFKVSKAFMCIGYKPWNESLYADLQQAWFILIFKPTLELKDGTVKWNVDAELVLHTMIQYSNYDQAVIVSGDGDFHCLVEYLDQKKKLHALILPNKYWYSSLLKKFRQYFFLLSRSLVDKIGKTKNEHSRRDGTHW